MAAMSLAQPPLHGLNLYVRDMKATVAFYRLVGLEIDDSQPWSAHHIEVKQPNGPSIEFDSYEMTASFDTGWQVPIGPSHLVMTFSMATREAVDEMHERMTAAGYKSRLAPIDAFWGARYAIVDDPDGNNVGFMSPTEDAYRTAPPPFARPE
jgi:predicted lactoylglutathione lyase